MAATINAPTSPVSAFDLMCKIDTNECINCAVLLRHREGVVVCSGKNIRIWLKRETGQYWPSVCKTMLGICLCMDYNHETQRLFVGLESGIITEFIVAEEYSKLIHQRDHFAHTAGVVAVLFSISCEWLLSIGRDKRFVWQCSETGRRLGCFDVADFCSSLQFDSPAKYAFVGDHSGNISVLRLRETSYELITRLSAHAGCVKTLVWDAERQWLFSGSYDKLIIVWDIGSKQGSAIELFGHNDRIVDLKLAEGYKKLFSVDEAGSLLCWDTTVTRKETPRWLSSNACQQCESPFFWNVKDMWSKRIVGLRQHHCRICGRAVCDRCSQHTLKYPPMGYELEIRVCDSCFRELDGKVFESWAVTQHTKHNLICISLDEVAGRLLTIGADKYLKIWDVKSALQ